VFPAPLVKVAMMWCIGSGMRLGSGGGDASSHVVSGLGLNEDASVFLLVGTASVLSESDSSFELSFSELAACES